MPKEPNPVPPQKPDENDREDETNRLGYYYDDAHGYQTYDPETDEEPVAENESAKDELKPLDHN